MARKTKTFFIAITLVFAFSWIASSQNQDGTLSLSEILSELENEYDVQFNYAEDAIANIKIVPPKNHDTINEAIKYLEENTNFVYIVLDQFILVNQKEELILCGFLKDIDQLSQLSEATVQGESSSTISDDNGFFQLKVSDENENIIIRHLGYKTISKAYNSFVTNNCFEIYLSSDIEALSEVVISNYLVKGINKLSDGSFEVDFSKFSILPGLIETDVLQSVQAFPGILSTNETVSNINIRGGTHDQNLILWDEIKMYQSGHFFGLISMYNPQITENVSLRKNGSDVTYTDGVSGTISMQTSKKINNKFNGTIGVNLIDANGFADIPLGKNASVQIAARKSISDFFKTPTYNEFFNRISQDSELATNSNNTVNSDQEFDFYDASFRLLYNVTENDELRFNFINVNNDLVFNENAIINNQAESRQSNLSQNSIAGALYYKRKWNDNWQSTLEIYETDYKLKAINVNILEAQRFLQENSVSESSAKIKVDYKLNEQLSILGGYHFVETEVTNLDDVDVPLFRFLVSEVVRTHGVFSQIGFSSSNNRTSVVAGIRFNYIDKFNKTIWEPRISLNHKILDHLTFEILGEFKHQNTSQIINFQSDFLGIEKRRWQLSNNTDIPVIESKQLSGGLHYNFAGWLISAEGYYKKVDGITTQSQGFQNQFEFVRTSGNYDVIGLDILIRKKIDQLSTWISYSYMDNTYTFKELQESSFRSNFDITHAVTIGTAYTAARLMLSAGLNWHSGKPTTQPVLNDELIDDQINFDATNSSNLDDYLRIDVSALYDFNIGNGTKAKAGISIWNVLDKENVINSFYSVNGENVNETVQRSLGFTPNAVLRVYF